MYKPKKIFNNGELFEFIDGNDVYNSSLVITLKDELENYNLTPYYLKHSDKRIDLIAKNTSLSESMISIINKLQKNQKVKKVDILNDNDLMDIIVKSLK